MARTGLTIGIAILILELFLLINASIIFPEQGDKIQNILIIYLILQATILAAFAAKLPGLTATPDSFILAIVGFIAALFIVGILPDFFASSFEPIIPPTIITGVSLFFLLSYAFVKSFIEEATFRGVLMPRIGIIPQAILFGLFHLAVLAAFGSTFLAVIFGAIFLTGLGYLFGLLAMRGGILFSTGVHLGYNIAALGLLGVFI